MITVHHLTFNPFAENTYLLVDRQNEAILVDPGMYDDRENAVLFEYLSRHEISIKRVLLTHAHVDHVFGLNYIEKQLGLKPAMHQNDEFIYKNAEQTASFYNVQIKTLPTDYSFIEENTRIQLDTEELEVILTPGHSPGSLSFISHEHRFIIGGDVLFEGSIGRTDLPGGDYQTLLTSIQESYLRLTDDYKVYSGHGPVTTIGRERKLNPFLQNL
jgi:glyoxylase-like metal-dependent hydrolase (beta-lactamase superfamily II)